MAIKSDRWIREQAIQQGMIQPFSEKQVKDGVISYGLSSYGYDLRVSNEFKIFPSFPSRPTPSSSRLIPLLWHARSSILRFQGMSSPSVSVNPPMRAAASS
jgi:dCTP deaminase